MDSFPLYRKGKDSGAIIKFIDDEVGYVVASGSSRYPVGSLHTDWNPYYKDCWEHYDYVEPGTSAKTPDQLELFETISLNSSTSITKVPNGYVMTSHSGHQILIPSNLI